MPLWPGTAHIVPLRPVGVEQGFGHSVQEVGEVGGERRSLTASSEYPNRGACCDHDACPLGSLSFRLLRSLVGQRAKRLGSIDGRLVALNLGDFVPTQLRNPSSFLRERYVDRGAADVTSVTSLSRL